MRVLFGDELDVALRTLDIMQWHPSRHIAERQWQQVCECVAYAKDASLFYRERFKACGVGGELTPEAFRKISPLSRSDIVSSWSTIRTARVTPGMVRRRSGGSSGQSVEIPLDRPTYCWYVAGTWRGLRWWGSDLTARGAIILGSGAGGLRGWAVRAKDWAMNWLRLSVDDDFDVMAPALLERIGAFAPVFIYGYPSAVHRLACTIEDRGGQQLRGLKVVVLTGEPVYAFQRHTIERVFQCPVAEEYGNGELGCMAFQCSEGTLHITAENVFLETVPTELSLNGLGGRILATQLRNRLFPLIRYEPGDIGVLGLEACRCGRGLPTLRMLGRMDDCLVGPDGVTLARPLIDQLFGGLPDPLRGRVQVCHTAPGRIVLRLERTDETPNGLRRVAAIGTAVFGSGWHVDVVETDRFSRLASGKLPYFVRPRA